MKAQDAGYLASALAISTHLVIAAFMKKYISVLYTRLIKRAIVHSVSLDRIEDERKVKHVVYTNIFTAIGAFAFVPVHLYIAQSTLAALCNAVCGFLGIVILLDLWARGRLKQSVWFTVILSSLLVIIVFWALQGEYQISAYLVIPAGFAFLLLGGRQGIAYSLCYFFVILILILSHIDTWPAFNQNSAALLNLLGAIVLSLFWGHIGEYIRGGSFQELEVIADSDTLTSAINRRSFFAHLHELKRRAEAEGITFAMMVIDIDYFKSVNDGFGHDSGDRVLVEMVKLMKSTVRSSDIVGRIGGEEFALLLPNLTKIEAVSKAGRLCKRVQRHVFTSVDGSKIPLTISIGVTVVTPDRDISVEDIYRSADRQLYQAKKSGRNRISIDAR